MSKATWPRDEVAWLAAHLSEGLPPVVYGTHGMGGYAASPGPRSLRMIAEPDEPTVEEIAHAANSGFVPLKHRAAYAKALAEKHAELVAAGRQISQREGQSEATLMALTNITRIGTGR